MTSSLNIKPLMAGLLLTGGILLYVAVALVPGKSISVPRTDTHDVRMLKLYRGVASDDPNYEEALKGIARPRGGNSSASMHQRGFTDSEFVSFSRSAAKAAAFATAQNKGGRGKGAILMIELPECDPRLVDVRNLPGGDMFKEQEVMIRGGIVGCRVAIIGANTLPEEFNFKNPKP